LNVINFISNPKWKEFIKHEPNNIDCLHCKYQKAEDSIPKEDFTVNKFDEEGNSTPLTISEITLDYGEHENVKGWYWSN